MDSTSTLIATAVVESERDDAYAQSIRTGKHHFTSDEPAALGGADAGPAPYQLLMGSLGACTAITLRMYAQRKKWTLGPLTVRLVLTREGDVERVTRTLKVSDFVTAEQRERLLDIASKTPVTKTLSKAMTITTTIAE